MTVMAANPLKSSKREKKKRTIFAKPKKKSSCRTCCCCVRLDSSYSSFRLTVTTKRVGTLKVFKIDEFDIFRE